MAGLPSVRAFDLAERDMAEDDAKNGDANNRADQAGNRPGIGGWRHRAGVIRLIAGIGWTVATWGWRIGARRIGRWIALVIGPCWILRHDIFLPTGGGRQRQAPQRPGTAQARESRSR